MIVLTANEMKKADLITEDKYKISTDILMERAALSVVKHILMYHPAKVLVIAGKGNNGGDGIAVARQLLENHGESVQVSLLLAHPMENLKDSVKLQYEIYLACGGNTVESFSCNEYDIIVDALLGIGISGKIRDRENELINQMNLCTENKNCKIISVDIPSGVCTDTGQILGNCVHANKTITFSYYKRGNILYPGCAASAKTYVENIGVPQKVIDDLKLISVCRTYSKEESVPMPQRKADGNKGTFGRVFVIAGSQNMYGACYLSALAAYRSGAGLVSILTHEKNRQLLSSKLPEAILTTFTDENLWNEEKVVEEIHKAKSIIVGPGIGTNATASLLTKTVMQHAQCPVIIDADAINCIAMDENLKSMLNCNKQKKWILTPHPAELSRLTNIEIADLLKDYPRTIQQFASEFGVVLVGKGAGSVVSGDDKLYINQSGNVGMATAGSGDVLSGMIAGLAAQGVEPIQAAINGVFLHGKCGDYALTKGNAYSLLAHDLCDALQYVISTE